LNLRGVQRLFLGLVVAPEGVAKALAEGDARGAGTRADVARVFSGDERMPAEGRLDVYANMYFFRLRDVLAEDFPRTAAALGEERWHNLVTDFLLAHPPTRWSLRWAGEDLPGFLREHAYGAERPWLSDVALLEWTRNEAFQARDVVPARAEDLLNVHPEVWPTLTFAPSPGTSVVSSRWDLAEWWVAGGEGAPAEASGTEALLVWRDAEGDVLHEVLDPRDAAAVERIFGGAPFAEVCDAFAPGDADAPAVEDAARRASGLLFRLIQRGGLVCTLHSAPAEQSVECRPDPGRRV
jgi:hypothetical protein